jgi:phage FluMu gp28-like protein
VTAPVTEKEWARLRADATAAIDRVVAEVGLPRVLLPYQAAVVRLLESAATRVLVVEKSRRIGLTWALAAYCVLRAAKSRAAGGMDAMYISYSQEMTREFIDACAMWARAFGQAAGAVDETIFPDRDETGERAIAAFRIRFASGFEVIALSSAPRALRGKQGVVVIDEAAFVDSLPELLKAALAFLMWGGQVIVCSTHDGADNPFNGLVQDVLAGQKPYAHLRIDFDAALRDGLYERIALVTGAEWSPEAEAAWRQGIVDFYGDGAEEELFCVPSLSSGAWLPGPLIEARMTADAPVLRLDLPPDYLHRTKLEQQALTAPFFEATREALGGLDLGLRYAAGFDFARVADLSVLPLLAVEPTLRRRLALTLEMRGVPGDEQKRAVAMVLSHLRERMIAAAFDATGMGWTVAEDMGRLFGLREADDGPGMIIPVKFTEEWYRVNMPPLKQAFEDDMIALGRDDAHLVDLRDVKVVRGIPRVPPLRTGAKDRRRHGDFAIGLALAHWASRMPAEEFGWRGAPIHRHRRAEGRLFDRPDHSADWQRGESRWWEAPAGAGLRGGI